MSEARERFERLLQSRAVPRGKALQAVAKKHPAGYTAWVKSMIAGAPYTAEGFDLARAKLEGAGLSRVEAMKECGRWHAGHGLWVDEQNAKRSSRKEQSRDRGTRAAASAAPGRSARSAGGRAYSAAVARYQAEGLTRGQAMSKAKRDDPEAFFAWVADCNAQQEEPSAERHQNRRESASDASSDVRIIGPQSAAPGAQTGVHQGLSAEDLARIKKRWEHPAFRAAWDDNFDLLVGYLEGRITRQEVISSHRLKTSHF